MNKFKIGLDIHGVIDSNPEFFAAFTRTMVAAGHEVHILTGPKITPKIINELKTMHIDFTHLFSITDHHEAVGTPIIWDEYGNPHMDAYLWDKTKAEYCKAQGIELHIDDSDSYAYFFKTPYARFYSKDTDRVRKTAILLPYSFFWELSSSSISLLITSCKASTCSASLRIKVG